MHLIVEERAVFVAKHQGRLRVTKTSSRWPKCRLCTWSKC